MNGQEVILSGGLADSLAALIGKCPHDKLFILTDGHTHALCLPRLADVTALKAAGEIVIGSEDTHKTLETLSTVWQALSSRGATRHSLLVNLGGGMVSDLGGFAAAT
ncbi:MAG: 3-dehydroquinate synthase, partial [Prevotellaceae bacterium]|nr:3-dehydroquinate synthase [Prevotellaceae bacterium]